MKQKNTPTKAKSQQNGVQKVQVKKQKKVENQEEQEAILEVLGKKAKISKNQKNAKAKAVANSEDDSGAEDVQLENESDLLEESDEELENESDSENENEEVPVSLVNENDSDEDEDEEEEVTENADIDSDDEPTEAPIAKIDTSEKPIRTVKGGIPKISNSDLPNDFPNEQVLIVTNLPKKFKQIDIVEVFAKYGSIHTINTTFAPAGNTVVIAFNTVEEAKAALAANKKETIKGSTISVALKKKTKKQKLAEDRQQGLKEHKQNIEESKDRTVYVSNLKKSTTADQVREHFAACGEVENVNIIVRKTFTFAFVVFTDSATVAEAVKKLHNSVLNGSTIGVSPKSADNNKQHVRDPKRTILLKNTKHLTTLNADQLTTIFGKCGDIDHIDVLCRKSVLAFVTFKDEKALQKALKLNGKTIDDIDVEIEPYVLPQDRPKTTIFAQNVKPGVTEEEIRELFAKTGEIETLFIKSGFAIIKFKEVDAFCKSFLLNESLLQGQMIFLEPYSEKKQTILKGHKPQLSGKKRPAQWKGGNKKPNQKRFKPN